METLFIKRVTFLILLILLFSATTFQVLAQNGYSASYEIEINQHNRQVAKVKASIVLKDSTIKMASWGHPYLQHGWATFVKNLEVETSSGKKLEISVVKKNGWGKWNVVAPNNTKLNLSYEVHFNHHDYDWDSAGGIDSRPDLTDDAHFLVTKALFIYSPGLNNASIKFNIPSKWQIGTNWEKQSKNTYFADSWINLVNNALVIGDFSKEEISNGQMKIVLVIDNKLKEHTSVFTEVLQKQLDEFSRIFNGTPKQNYLISIRESFLDDGESFHDSFNQVMVNGRIKERFIIWANTMTHEMFHYWNGNFFLAGEKPDDLYWFTEGFTEYYASLSLMRTGMISEATYLKKLEHYISRYVITKTLWPVDQINLVEAGKEKNKNWLFIYGGGAVMALTLDIEIRTLTNNEKSLDDVMLLLKQKYGDKKLKITNDDIKNAVSETCGKDYSQFFNDYVYGKNKFVNMQKALLKAGLHMDRFSDEIFLSRKKTEDSILFDKMINNSKKEK